MKGYRVPIVPMVTIRATYECHFFPDECGRCGAEVHTVDGAALDYRGEFYHGGGWMCPKCGNIPSAEVSPAEDPAEWGGFCDPSNPWGTLDDHYKGPNAPDTDEVDEPIEIVLPLYEARNFLLNFPGSVWDGPEGEHEKNMHTGVCRGVTAHVQDGPGAVAVFELAWPDPTLQVPAFACQ